MSFAENLLRVMKQRQISFGILSTKSKVSRSTIHGWTTGRRVQDLRELKKVSNILEISIHELVFGEPDPYASFPQEILKELFSGDLRVTVHKIERNRGK